MGMLEKTEIPRKVCPLIVILDQSISMDGEPIGAENTALEGTLPELVAMNDNNPDAIIKIGFLAFSTGYKWLTGEDGLIDPKDYIWSDLSVEGATSLGAALREVNKQLSVSHGFMKEASGSMSPVIILISDGEPTDSYKGPLDELKKNNWYRVAAKIAIGYGAANDALLEEFTGNRETVLHTNDPKELLKLIKFVAVTSSMVVSTGKQMENDDDIADPDDATNAVANALKTAQPTLSDAVDPDEEW